MQKDVVKKIILFLIFILVLSGCGKNDENIVDSNNKIPDNIDNIVSERGFYIGIAGLVPANYPKPSNADWADLFASIGNYGEVFGDYVEWDDDLKDDVPGQMKIVEDLSKKQGFIPVYALGFKKIKKDFFKNDGEKYKEVAIAAARELKPNYLGLGVEVNTLYEDDPNDFDYYVDIYKESYDEIKKISPDTKVFPIFQLEYTKGEGMLSGRKRDPEWFLIGKFDGKMDLIGFTTYPMLDYEDPKDIPADYYEEIKKYSDKKVAFTELAWLSGSINGRTSSETEQAEFLDRFLELTRNIDKEFIIWTLPHDLNGNNLFSTIALRHNDGSEKEIYSKWAKLKGE